MEKLALALDEEIEKTVKELENSSRKVLAKEFKSAAIHMEYADDVAQGLHSDPSNQFLNERLFKVFEKFEEDTSMTFATKKTFVLKDGAQNTEETRFMFKNEELEASEKITYLGVEFESNFGKNARVSLKNQAQKSVDKFALLLSKASRFCACANSLGVCKRIYLTYINPHLSYSSSLSQYHFRPTLKTKANISFQRYFARIKLKKNVSLSDIPYTPSQLAVIQDLRLAWEIFNDKSFLKIRHFGIIKKESAFEIKNETPPNYVFNDELPFPQLINDIYGFDRNYTLACFYYSFESQIVNFWNQLPFEIQKCDVKSEFMAYVMENIVLADLQSEKIRLEIFSGEARAKLIRFSNYKKHFHNIKKQAENFMKLLSVLNDDNFANFDFLHEDFDYNENVKLIETLNSNRFQFYQF